MDFTTTNKIKRRTEKVRRFFIESGIQSKKSTPQEIFLAGLFITEEVSYFEKQEEKSSSVYFLFSSDCFVTRVTTGTSTSPKSIANAPAFMGEGSAIPRNVLGASE